MKKNQRSNQELKYKTQSYVSNENKPTRYTVSTKRCDNKFDLTDILSMSARNAFRLGNKLQ